ncbi:universal stress protein [Azospirillum sp. sgz301742]
MDMRSILVLVGAEPRSMASLGALDVAQLFDASVTGLRVPFWPEAGWFIDVPQEPPTLSADTDTEPGFIALCSEYGRGCDWIAEDGPAVERLAFHSRYADLVVVGRAREPGDTGALAVADLGRLALTAAAPVLVVPPETCAPFRPHRVLVAWNERREAARALREALPLLRRAKEVVLLSVHPAGYDDGPDHRIVEHLARHRIKAEARINFATEFEAPGAILAQAHALDADLIVMGAYGHSRAFENVLGGATRYLLEHGDRPILMTH